MGTHYREYYEDMLTILAQMNSAFSVSPLAQSIEQVICDGKVKGSSPTLGIFKRFFCCLLSPRFFKKAKGIL